MSLLDLEFDLPKQRAMPSFDEITAACRPLIDMGAALHWLRPKKKAPLDQNWSTAPVHSYEQLRESYREGNNVGIRLGEPSHTPYGYLHVIDLDIRSREFEAEAWQRLNELMPEARSLPSVVSGSGGSSRHLYFFTQKPIKSEKLCKSSTFKMVFDANLGREVKKSDWEIDLFGTGKQVVLPPSIHPETGKPYIWERPFDFLMMDLGVIPTVSTDFADYSSELDDDDDGFGDFVRQAPMNLDEDEITKIIARLPEDWVDDRDQWLQVGMALAHQYEGGQKGFDRWCEWSKESPKFDMKSQKASWKSFKGASNPVRMASLIAATADTLLQDNLPALYVEEDPLDSLLGPPSDTPKDTKPAPLMDWQSLFDRNEEGQPRSGLLNTRLVLQNDLRTHGILAMNQFRQREVIIAKPKRIAQKENRKPPIQLEGAIWNVPDPVNGELWKEDHCNVVREMIEAPKTQGGYGFKVTDRDLYAAINIVANQNAYHPVKQYLEQHTWDEERRVDTLFIDYLGCADTPYHREAARWTLVAAVARIYEPGQKFDFVPILEGVQGKRKSTFISILGRGWFSELTGDFHDAKTMIENIQGRWIIEIPELQGFSRADTNVLKAFLSRTTDSARKAFGRYVQDFPRQCIFFGSTNDSDYLRDHTGGRRFWPIACNLEGEIDTDRLEREIDQVWAEAVAIYQSMREHIKLKNLPLHMTSDEAKNEAILLQDGRRVETAEDTLAGMIEKWLEEPIGVSAGYDDLDPSAPAIYRNATCAMQVWTELLGKDIAAYGQADRVKLGGALARLKGWSKLCRTRTDKFGQQMVYVRSKSTSLGEEL